ncbi:S8/S53 family peptidase [Candidatus Thiosymbion oneisti]|uniref:S8/S53 family peptidase n=1 Tax=Candidatus Thiosymbion oneisti TaxID=589554 RepID=UPI0013FD79CB|nr:S8/S53 family peptidase [Candidatus Thiosymbion oneisti]
MKRKRSWGPRFHLFLLVIVFAWSGWVSAQDPDTTNGIDTGGTPYLQLKIDGELSPEAKEALTKLLEPDAVSQLKNLVNDSGLPEKKFSERAPAAYREATKVVKKPARIDITSFMGNIEKLSSASKPAIDTPVTTDTPSLPTITVEGSLPLDPDDPFSGEGTKNIFAVLPERAFSPDSHDPEGITLVPVDGKVIQPIPGADGKIVGGLAGNWQPIQKLDLIENDLHTSGISDRQFPVNPTLSAEKVDELVEIVRTASRGAATAEVLDEPEEGFSFIQPEVVFEASGSECSPMPSDWPYRVDDVVEVMQFNQRIHARLGLEVFPRARIVILDTGLGAKLAQSKPLKNLLFVDTAELLTLSTRRVSYSGQGKCYDGNSNGFYSDVFGTSARLSSKEQRDHCQNQDYHLSHIHPLEKKFDSKKQVYQPEHGSFVAGLAAGGLDFIAKFPELNRYLGLTIFRVTRPSPSKSLSVINDPSDIADGLEYAGIVGADVVNLSLKTREEHPFKDLGTKTNALLVTSAGNNAEDLDRLGASENRPADLERLEGEARMIVVAAVQPKGSDTFLWPKSARSAQKVHIAAPGVFITSFNTVGEQICMNGTSAAAPLVSFTAAMVKGLITGASRELIRARVLSSASNHPELANHVQEGRVLDIPAALDVFVDRLLVVQPPGGKPSLLRGWIEPDHSQTLIEICDPDDSALKPSRGEIDLSLLWEWRQSDKNEMVFFHHKKELFIFSRQTCRAPTGSFSFYDLSRNKTISVSWSNVRKMLPTPFRGVREAVLAEGGAG